MDLTPVPNEFEIWHLAAALPLGVLRAVVGSSILVMNLIVRVSLASSLLLYLSRDKEKAPRISASSSFSSYFFSFSSTWESHF
jgi:hypothetical protein